MQPCMRVGALTRLRSRPLQRRAARHLRTQGPKALVLGSRGPATPLTRSAACRQTSCLPPGGGILQRFVSLPAREIDTKRPPPVPYAPWRQLINYSGPGPETARHAAKPWRVQTLDFCPGFSGEAPTLPRVVGACWLRLSIQQERSGGWVCADAGEWPASITVQRREAAARLTCHMAAPPPRSRWGRWWGRAPWRGSARAQKRLSAGAGPAYNGKATASKWCKGVDAKVTHKRHRAGGNQCAP